MELVGAELAAELLLCAEEELAAGLEELEAAAGCEDDVADPEEAVEED